MLVVSKGSCNLQHRHVKDTGRELLDLNLSPFLNKAVTLAYFTEDKSNKACGSDLIASRI
jgi:hypothetical protein